jgi:hypothetical protein
VIRDNAWQSLRKTVQPFTRSAIVKGKGKRQKGKEPGTSRGAARCLLHPARRAAKIDPIDALRHH